MILGPFLIIILFISYFKKQIRNYKKKKQNKIYEDNKIKDEDNKIKDKDDTFTKYKKY